MPRDPTTHVLEIWGDFACFARPEMKVERWSYPCPTPSAARGIFDAIYFKADRDDGQFKPRFYWQVTKIELLAAPSYIALRRNEVKDNINVNSVKDWMAGKGAINPIWADADKSMTGSDERGRTQRQTMALRNPHFRLHAHIVPHPGFEGQLVAFEEQFARRASHGKCAWQPCLGCREFVAFFRPVEDLAGEERDKPPVAYGQEIGMMLYDVFDLSKPQDSYAAPFITLFIAEISGGVLNVPPFDSSKVFKPSRGERRASDAS